VGAGGANSNEGTDTVVLYTLKFMKVYMYYVVSHFLCEGPEAKTAGLKAEKIIFLHFFSLFCFCAAFLFQLSLQYCRWRNVCKGRTPTVLS
jgi:hypothetical protein